MKVTKQQIKEIVRKVLKEGTGGMSSASMGGPMLAEEESSEFYRGYSVGMKEASVVLNKMADNVQDSTLATELRNLSRQLEGKGVKAKSKGFKLGALKEMFSKELEPRFKKLDQVSNLIGKHKLLYQWVKAGNVSFKEYLELSKYLFEDPADL